MSWELRISGHTDDPRQEHAIARVCQSFMKELASKHHIAHASFGGNSWDWVIGGDDWGALPELLPDMPRSEPVPRPLPVPQSVADELEHAVVRDISEMGRPLTDEPTVPSVPDTPTAVERGVRDPATDTGIEDLGPTTTEDLGASAEVEADG